MTRESVRRLQIEQLRELGFVIIPEIFASSELQALNATARQQLAGRTAPVEFEADLQYPGAPPSRSAEGGSTIRRLLSAYQRDPGFSAAATMPAVREWMSDYFAEDVLMSRVHHNCLMTKHPLYGSLTGWHRDIRYWSFDRQDLISVWFALGAETVENGGLWFVPGSHRMSFDPLQFDAAQFFRADLPGNVAIISGASAPPLKAGDAVFFHSNTLHSAGRNTSDAIKFSLAFTYHGSSNPPLAGTRSSSAAEVLLRD